MDVALAVRQRRMKLSPAHFLFKNLLFAGKRVPYRPPYEHNPIKFERPFVFRANLYSKYFGLDGLVELMPPRFFGPNLCAYFLGLLPFFAQRLPPKTPAGVRPT